MRLIEPTPDWYARAACTTQAAADQLDLPLDLLPSLFYSPHPRDIADAKAICHVCPVRQECLDHATTTREPHGVWGGLDEWQRTTI